MRIGELAKQTGMSTSAIRYYEDSGLLPAGKRGLNQYRDYDQQAVERLQFIQLAQRLGFSLDALRGLFEKFEDELPHEQILAGLERRLTEITQLRAELAEQERELRRLAQACRESWARGECVETSSLGAGQGSKRASLKRKSSASLAR
ncbi:MerR family transcriptional regulator [Dyella sp.]|uniref:MerR family transcriptional regulator n=1 Tax=Dyella sp. TaxID=1869338 RepID=UPI00284432CA|nr:MerR family transcriptional regulator [Dyella sp.]MDR3446877.1 MerR family transcriptional regulator [Dyella sp.]